MHCVYYPGDLAIGDQVELSPAETHHARKVKRIETGITVWVVNGRGQKGEALLVEYRGKIAVLKIHQLEQYKPSDVGVHMLVAPPKTAARWDWILEKSVEFGVRRMTPVFTRHSERRKVNVEKAEKALIQAMKQSKNPFLPELMKPVDIRNIPVKELGEKRFVAHCRTKPEAFLFNLLEKGHSASVLIGPEGDFSENEIQWLNHGGWKPVWLGPHILRTESAVLAAVNQFNTKQWS